MIQLIDTSDKTTSRITSSCWTVRQRKVDGIFHPSLTTISFESRALWLVIMISSDTDEKSS